MYWNRLRLLPSFLISKPNVQDIIETKSTFFDH